MTGFWKTNHTVILGLFHFTTPIAALIYTSHTAISNWFAFLELFLANPVQS